MADQFINIAKPILIGELTKQIKKHDKDFDIVEGKIDTIITELKTQLGPFTSIIAGIKSIPFGDPTKKLQELSDELKLKLDSIDFSELEKIPDIDPTLKDRIKALPDKVKTKLKDLVDELITGKAPETTTNGTVDASSKVETIMPPPPPSKAEEEEAATTEVTTEAVATGYERLDNDEKNETIDKIMKMLEETGVLEEIKKKICTAAAPPAPAAAPPAAPPATAPPTGVGGAKKRRRKTKKNIRRNNNGKTRFGRTF
jgi:hypothetical protein